MWTRGRLPQESFTDFIVSLTLSLIIGRNNLLAGRTKSFLKVKIKQKSSWDYWLSISDKVLLLA